MNRLLPQRVASFPKVIVPALFMAAFYTLSAPDAHARGPKVSLASTQSADGSTWNFVLTPSQSLQGCSVTLYGATSSSALKRSFSRATFLTAIAGPSAQQTLAAPSPGTMFSNKRRPRKKSLSFRAAIDCSGTVLLSKRSSLKILPSSSGVYRTSGELLARLPGTLYDPANGTPTPTPTPMPTPPPVTGVQVVRAHSQLSFSAPVDLQNCGDNRLFVVEQAGRIKVFPNTPGAAASTFLDITSKVKFNGEQGLLSMAFHPNYATNGIFFVHYSEKTNGNTTVARYRVSVGDPNVADASSEEILLTAVQPFANHNGGQIAFGPDGYLYIGLGDGGSGGDPQGNGQKRTTLLGKILRINVDATQGSLAYAIPSDNPFVGNTSGFKEEIYAYGMRNPWKSSFDSATGTLWVADVGQGSWEEVDIVTKGGNYGWNTMEGDVCYPSGGSNCNQTGLTLPVISYSHSEGSSITGGYVYHGTSVPQLEGRYLYADFIAGKIWALFMSGGTGHTQLLFDTSSLISSFGVDRNGEVYFFDYGSGALYTFAQM